MKKIFKGIPNFIEADVYYFREKVSHALRREVLFRVFRSEPYVNTVN